MVISSDMLKEPVKIGEIVVDPIERPELRTATLTLADKDCGFLHGSVLPKIHPTFFRSEMSISQIRAIK